MGQNIELLVVVATNYALFATQNTRLPYENVLSTTNSNGCTYPLVIANIEVIILVDTGASNVSSTIISLINQKANKKPIRTKSEQIQTLKRNK